MNARLAFLTQRVRKASWLAGLLALAGMLVFLAQSHNYARTSASSLDEGAYLYKGWLFASGQYRPFEPFGPQTNKAPLSFLIPGFAQLIFGPGLRTGRGLAVVFGLLTVILTWWTARRLTNGWIAAASVWAFALSPVLAKTFSEGVTQSEVAFTLVLTLTLSLGEDRRGWQLALSGFMAGVMIMIRQNMVIVLPLLVLYIWWQYGWKKALAAALTGAAVLVFFHVLYWPYIMGLWVPWIPGALKGWLANVFYSSGGISGWNPNIDLAGRLLSFFQGLRFHFAALGGFVIALLLWPRRAVFTQARFRQIVFLAALFAGLLLMHSWAAIGNDYCVYCFTPYLAFFSLTGILLAGLLLPLAPPRLPAWRGILTALGVLILSVGLGYSLVEELGDPLLGVNVPRVRGGRILPGVISLWDLLSNKFGWERAVAERIVSAAAGLITGAALVLIVLLILARLRRSGFSFGYVLGLSFLILGLLFSPLLAGSAGRPDCPGMDVIRANEQAGEYLAQYIAPGRMTYWNGGLSVAPLLYAPQVQIYLPQINDGYAYLHGGDTQESLKYGYWNDELDSRWQAEADYIIVEGWRYTDMKDRLPASEFDEFPRSPGQTSCLNGSGLRLFQRK